MASNDALNNLFTMMIERLNHVEMKIDELQKQDFKLLKNLCDCQISTLEITKEPCSFKINTKSPVYNCKICGWCGKK